MTTGVEVQADDGARACTPGACNVTGYGRERTLRAPRACVCATDHATSTSHRPCLHCVASGGEMPVELPEGAPVAVFAVGKEHAMAIGVLKMSTADM